MTKLNNTKAEAWLMQPTIRSNDKECLMSNIDNLLRMVSSKNASVTAFLLSTLSQLSPEISLLNFFTDFQIGHADDRFAH